MDLFDLADGGESNFVKSLLNPRPTIGGTLNLDDDGTDYIHAGLVWHFEVTETFFVEAGFGGGWNNGSDAGTATRAAIGSNFLFNESFAIGANIAENLTFLVQIDHLSHAGLGGNNNRGLTNLSARIGYKF